MNATPPFSDFLDPHGNGMVASSEKLKIFIEKYGVNFRVGEISIHHYMRYMKREQIGLLFENGLDIVVEGKMCYLPYDCNNGCYILKKYLDHKDGYMFLKYQVDELCVSGGVRYWRWGRKPVFLIDKLERDDYFSDYKEMFVMMVNFEKKLYTLFNLLLPFIEYNYSNKKSKSLLKKNGRYFKWI